MAMSEMDWGHRQYLAIQAKKAGLDDKNKKLFNQLEQIELGRHDVSVSTMLMIADVYNNNAINSFSTVFKLGFLQGQKAEKARRIKQVKVNE